MKIATFNVNGINGRLPVLLRWLAEAAPDVVCLQELKAPQERFPVAALRDAGYGAIWHGQKSWNGVAILARGADPTETGRGLPGDLEDTQSRYIEAAVGGVIVGCLYLPNGNPAPMSITVFLQFEAKVGILRGRVMFSGRRTSASWAGLSRPSSSTSSATPWPVPSPLARCASRSSRRIRLRGAAW